MLPLSGEQPVSKLRKSPHLSAYSRRYFSQIFSGSEYHKWTRASHENLIDRRLTRPCKLNGDGLKNVADWMEQYRKFWEESFDRLDAYLKTVVKNEKPPKGKKNGRKK